LAEENRQKYLNLENQKMIVALMEDEKKKMSSIINKMGEKIMSLEEVNQSLKEAVAKASGEPSETDESYYRTTRAKVGQFYYKK
jgi:K+/H+ antiporter YhaU regulatory subunit KhtT